MEQKQQDGFVTAISRCRAAYAAFEQLAGRTDAALYQSLSHVYALQYRMSTDAELRAKFDELLQASARQPPNETVFLVKYLFFPDTLQPGPGHKAEIDKASRYAKLLNLAWAKDIQPSDFIAFARETGIQRTAVAGKRHRAGRARRHGRRAGIRYSGTVVHADTGIFADALSPRESWFYRQSVADRFAHAVDRSGTQPQKITFTVYINHERAVITGLTARDCSGAFPAGAIKLAGSPAGQSAPPSQAKANPLPQLRASPPHRRPVFASPVRSLARYRQRTADGIVWPSWR